jgi:transcriptional regulator with XRE-family HTH domain
MSNAPEPQIPQFEVRHRLALALEAAGVSTEDMADTLGVHRNTIGNYLRGNTRPRKLVLQAWALRCGVPYTWLAEGETTPPRPKGGGRRPAKLRGRDSNPQPHGFRLNARPARRAA